MATRWLRKGESQNAGVGVDRNCESIFSGDRDVTAATRGRPANQRGPWAQPGERPDGPIRGLAARCVTGRTPHAVANQRAPRLVRANVTERTKGAQGACARVSVTASARARGRRERKREERRGEGRRGEARRRWRWRQRRRHRRKFPAPPPTGARSRGSARFPPRGVGGAAPPGPASDARGRAERRAGPRAL